MESFIANKQNQKRKKRKTRKNLDALREKARKSSHHSDHNKENKIKTCSKNKNCAAKPICITTNRLTLFRKAVSSDTVSRKMICDEKNKAELRNKINNKNKFLANLIQPLKEQVTVVSANSSNQSASCISDEDEHTNDKVTRNRSEVRTPTSIILFSPSNSNESMDMSENLPNNINTQQSDNSLSDTSPINNSYSQNDFYVNFINEIPKYLQETVPELLKTDFINKKMKSIRNKFIGRNLISEESSPSNSETLKYSSNESSFDNKINVASFSGQSFSHTELTSPPVSMASNTSVRKSSSPLSFIMSDSPEYIYYPHKLNP